MSDKQNIMDPQTAEKPNEATTTESQGGCCAPSELAGCCAPDDKAGCCGAPVLDKAPSRCGCR